MTSSNELISEWNNLETQIQEKLEEVEKLRQQQKAVEEKLPRLYFVQGFGQQGLAARVHFVGPHEECLKWVGHNPSLEMTEDNLQIRRKGVPQVGSYPVAGIIDYVVPVDERWFEILAWPDLGKGESKTIISE